MTTSLRGELLKRGGEIRAVARRNLAARPRLYGSVARGDDNPESDIDILVDPEPGCSLLDLAGMESELEDIFGRRVEVRTIKDLHFKMRPSALADALPL